MNKIGVFYGSTTGTTEDVAHRIAEKLNVPNGDIHDASKLNDELVKEYDVLVLGTSTWGAGELQDDWYDGIKVLKKCDLSHKYVALFGCGDSDSYSDTFCDAIGILYEELKDMKSNVHISALCPGPVDTNFNETANVIFALKGISAEYCAAYALIKMFKKTLIIIPTFKMKAAILSAKLSPRKAALAITKHQQRKKL